jgi:hypothetical protein
MIVFKMTYLIFHDLQQSVNSPMKHAYYKMFLRNMKNFIGYFESHTLN